MTVAYFNTHLRQVIPGAPYCLDHLCTLAAGGAAHARIDIIKLDNWLIRRHGKYKGSMRNRLNKLFGKAAEKFVIEALGPNNSEKEK